MFWKNPRWLHIDNVSRRHDDYRRGYFGSPNSCNVTPGKSQLLAIQTNNIQRELAGEVAARDEAHGGWVGRHEGRFLRGFPGQVPPGVPADGKLFTTQIDELQEVIMEKTALIINFTTAMADWRQKYTQRHGLLAILIDVYLMEEIQSEAARIKGE